jgi:hypothetical protein
LKSNNSVIERAAAWLQRYGVVSHKAGSKTTRGTLWWALNLRRPLQCQVALEDVEEAFRRVPKIHVNPETGETNLMAQLTFSAARGGGRR